MEGPLRQRPGVRRTYKGNATIMTGRTGHVLPPKEKDAQPSCANTVTRSSREYEKK